MKFLTIVLLAIAYMASSTCQAADTLVVTSYNIVDRCSGDSSWVISAGIGQVNVSDSLMSLDISILYDTSKVRPTLGLTEGTLSKQLSEFGGPIYNFSTPGEMRVSAFSINTPARGNLPLVAFTGYYKGKCGTYDSLRAPFFGFQFNEEFKRNVVALRSERIEAVANAKQDSNFGVQIDIDTVRIADTANASTAEVKILTSRGHDSRMTVDIEMVQQDVVEIDTLTIRTQLNGVAFQRITPWHIKAQFDVVKQDTIVAEAKLKRTADQKLSVQTSMKGYASIEKECNCYLPTRKDSIIVLADSAITTGINEKTELHERSAKLQGIHGKAGKIVVVNILGQIVLQRDVFEGWTASQVFQNLQQSVYLIMFEDEMSNTTTLPYLN